ncbi:MAG: sulfite exporter TauE/SafE family protein [candidate division Zixibacteria bacterium]|nr:sulfite exporter TauE/SafE family protein [candidate division Zixibacteria bacterium]
MMPEMLLFVLCGLLAGLLGGYLGLGGGIVMVPFLTVVAGLNIKVAVPVSVTAIVVNSLASSNEYLKKGMVDLELVVALSVFSILGNITGSNLIDAVPGNVIRLILAVILAYTALSLLTKKGPEKRVGFEDNRRRYLMVCVVIAFLAGVLSALVGIGGGVILVPLLYTIIGLPLTTARGTSSLMIGFSSAAAAAVYLLNERTDFAVVAPVAAGIIVGAKLGGFLGTMAKPVAVKILFFLVMLYLAYKLSYDALAGVI